MLLVSRHSPWSLFPDLLAPFPVAGPGVEFSACNVLVSHRPAGHPGPVYDRFTTVVC